MSLFGAINTAISGLTAQSGAFGNISDDIANSQSTGYKRVDTTFQDYLTTSTAQHNEPGAVVARPDYVNDVQGSISQTDNQLALAITGHGFFAVSQETGHNTSTAGALTFSDQQYYTRDGNFSMNKQRYLVNDAGQYLNGWAVNPTTGAVNQNALVPIQVTQLSYNPVATANVALSANLPATPASGTATTASPLSSQITVYDALGTSHTVTMNWTQSAQNQWSVQIAYTDPATNTVINAGAADVAFGGTQIDGSPVAAGTIRSIAPTAAPGPTVTTSSYSQGQPVTMTFEAIFGSGSQPITLNLGTYGSTQGVTQYAGTTYNLLGLTQDGVPPGSFSSTTMAANGDVIVNYNNGQTRTIGQIPIITFNAPDQLQRENGQAFTATAMSGTPLANAAGVNGAGNLVTSSIEGSNVDIATEFSSLIVAQQAYSANAKVVTTGNQMLQITISMLA